MELIGIPNRKATTELEKFKLANEQALFVVEKKLPLYYSNLKWMVTEDYLDHEHFSVEDFLENKIGNPETNRCVGDIVGIDPITHCPKCWIDLKMAEKDTNPNFVGTITLSSYYGFGHRSFANHFYLCGNESGTKVCLVPANFINTLIVSGQQFIKKSYHRKHDLFDTTYNKLTKYYDEPVDYVSGCDFVPSKFILKHTIPFDTIK